MWPGLGGKLCTKFVNGKDACLSRAQGGDPIVMFSRGEKRVMFAGNMGRSCFFFSLGIEPYRLVGDFTVHTFFIFSHRHGMMILNDCIFFRVVAQSLK